ncbi:hypothetical protein HYH02_011021 [Chlamydomonas schloesseri]|uniref:Uncharacterized protein n=1 Tax=Chlamydomonas schloesseri TaxID=2026947 RepID=A0A835T3T3_9CHLO|nr:hypothetical protein HYH02_011021 [Chlamydomonas schloesseri]|eukprot:KAG2438324.1 hypothetical protein HYH02_011021 [Chlamydomonas schloesseri]
MDGDELDQAKWDQWSRLLAGLAGQVGGSKRDDGVMQRLYELAVELRDKLRYSQGRLRTVKQELAVTTAAARSERQESLARLRELETEVARLAGAVQSQGSTLAARETVASATAAENEQLRRHVAALEKQLQRTEEDRLVTITERNEALRHLDKMTQLLEDSENRAATAQAEHSGLLSELVATKGRLADMSALETLYGAARDELQRLDKENLELKDMVAGGSAVLGRSRILEALGIPDSSDVFMSTRGPGGGGGRRGGSGRSRSAPRTRRLSASASPAAGAAAITASTRGAFVPELVPLTADVYRSSGGKALARPLSPGRGTMRSPGGGGAVSGGLLGAYRGGGGGGGGSQMLEDPVSDMAFLGPPSSAYPPDPENYVFYRVGGGYATKIDPLQPVVPQPRASGWVPKDVVRLVQAFRHSYGLSLEWRFWEPLVLMIDEVYRSRADGTLAAMRAAQREKLKTVKRQMRSALGYPSALANGKIGHLQRQLTNARKTLADGDRKGDVTLKQMAVKDYHLGYQLDRAVEENHALRRSLEELEELYTSALSTGGGGGGGTGGRAGAGAAGGPSPGGAGSPPPPPHVSRGGASAAAYNPYGSPVGPSAGGASGVSASPSSAAAYVSPRGLAPHHHALLYPQHQHQHQHQQHQQQYQAAMGRAAAAALASNGGGGGNGHGGHYGNGGDDVTSIGGGVSEGAYSRHTSLGSGAHAAGAYGGGAGAGGGVGHGHGGVSAAAHL